MSRRLLFTNNRPVNIDNHYVVGAGVGRQSSFVRSALRRNSSNNAQGIPCCSSITTDTAPHTPTCPPCDCSGDEGDGKRSWLFAIKAEEGELQHQGKNEYTIEFKEESHDAIAFTDRPFRQSINYTGKELLQLFSQPGGLGDTFTNDPPNATFSFSSNDKDGKSLSYLLVAKITKMNIYNPEDEASSDYFSAATAAADAAAAGRYETAMLHHEYIRDPRSLELTRVYWGAAWALHSFVLEFADGSRHGVIQNKEHILQPLTELDIHTVHPNCDRSLNIYPTGDHVVRVIGHGLKPGSPPYLCYSLTLIMSSGREHVFSSNHDEWKGGPFNIDVRGAPRNTLMEMYFNYGTCAGMRLGVLSERNLLCSKPQKRDTISITVDDSIDETVDENVPYRSNTNTAIGVATRRRLYRGARRVLPLVAAAAFATIKFTFEVLNDTQNFEVLKVLKQNYNGPFMNHVNMFIDVWTLIGCGFANNDTNQPLSAPSTQCDFGTTRK
jgi:hypothetical protein